jgi:hypothetical protein
MAIYEDMIYFFAHDGAIVALDAKTPLESTSRKPRRGCEACGVKLAARGPRGSSRNAQYAITPKQMVVVRYREKY